MNLREAKQLKIGDILYHHSLFYSNGKRATATVKGSVIMESGFPPKWAISVQDDDSKSPRMLNGKYAFNWSVIPL